MITLEINGKSTSVDVEPEMPLLWVIREQLGLTGTKFGCGIAQCGACTVLIDGDPMRSCSYPMVAAAGRKVTTIEGLSPDGSHKLQNSVCRVIVALGKGKANFTAVHSNKPPHVDSGGDNVKE